MAEDNDSSDKSHEPSQRKLDEARKKGEIARAPDLLTATAYLGLLVVGFAAGAGSLMAFGTALMPLLEQPDRLAPLFFRDGASAPAGGLMASSLGPAMPWLTVPGLFVILALLAQRGLVFTPSKLAPKISRLSPIENAKNKYGRRGLFEFFKSFTKLTVYSICLGLFLMAELDTIAGSPQGGPQDAVVLMGQLTMKFLTIVLVIAAAIGALDFFWQRQEHMRRNRMSHKELRDEFKEVEGDPMIKQQRRAKAQAIAMNGMMADVPDSDVVIVNPTHYAVALKWTREPGAAPVCVAKGTDEIARRIREIAAENGVPIHSDPPTARALHATTEIGQEISADHYRPVAAAIRFADDMRRRARGMKGGWR